MDMKSADRRFALLCACFPSHGGLFGLQQLIVSLAEQKLHAGIDVFSGCPVQADQGARVALFLRHAGLAAKRGQLPVEVGAVDDAAGAGDEHRPGGQAGLVGVLQNLAAQAAWAEKGETLPLQLQFGLPGAHRLDRDQLQKPQRQPGGGKQLDQQVQPAPAFPPGRAQQAQVFGPGQLRTFGGGGLHVAQQQVGPAAPAQVPVGGRQMQVDRARLQPPPDQALPPPLQRLRADRAVPGHPVPQAVQAAAVQLDGLAAAAPGRFPPQKFLDGVPLQNFSAVSHWSSLPYTGHQIRKYSFVSIICHVPPFSRDDLPGKTYRTENRAQKSRLGKNQTLVQPDFRVIFYESLRDKAYLLDFLYRPCYYVGVIPQPVEGYCFTFCAVDFFVQI